MLLQTPQIFLEHFICRHPNCVLGMGLDDCFHFVVDFVKGVPANDASEVIDKVVLQPQGSVEALVSLLLSHPVIDGDYEVRVLRLQEYGNGV